MTRKWRHLTGGHLEVALKGLYVRFWVRLSSYRPVTRKKVEWSDMKRCHMSGGDWKCPEVTSFDRKSAGSGCRRPLSQVLGSFELLHGCNSQEVAVTRQEMTHVIGSDQK